MAFIDTHSFSGWVVYPIPYTLGAAALLAAFTSPIVVRLALSIENAADKVQLALPLSMGVVY
jgi:hypothetical protein